MSGWKKLASAAAAAGGGLNVEDVFSTYLYTGTGAAQTITNGLDLANEGGLVWHKARESASNNDHSLFDSETSTGSTFPSIQKAWESNVAGSLAARTAWTFNSDGFTTTASDGSNGTDQNGIDYVTWSFRKCPKFFDVVNYTGNGTSGRTISHNLGVVPAMIIVLGQGAGDYWVYHKDVGNTKYLELNKTTAAQTNSSAWNNTTPTDSVFTVGNGTPVNYNNIQYTAYLFAHNDGDGDFGPTGDQDIIKCGSFTTASSIQMQSVDVGFEPQFVLMKCASSTDNWMMIDVMRGAPIVTVSAGDSARLRANLSNAESTDTVLHPTATGFDYRIDNTSSDYIYIAIRRGPMAVPESATDVFAIDTKTDDPRPAFISDFPVDMALWRRKHTTDNWSNSARLIQGKFLYTNSTAGEGSNTINAFDYQDGWYNDQGADNRILSWMWRRAPNFFDVVAYTGNGTAGRTVSHNLGVVPEMMWVFRRNTTANRYVYHAGVNNGATNTTLVLDGNFSVSDLGNFDFMNGTQPTASVFSLSHTAANINNYTYIAYLFASLDGVSKVGSYTGNGGTSVTGTGQNIDCGFSNGARFVLIKPTNAADNWFFYDSERGIVAGNDATLQLNLTAAQSTSSDEIDPLNSGFTILNGNNQLNRTGREYIFYAIA